MRRRHLAWATLIGLVVGIAAIGSMPLPAAASTGSFTRTDGTIDFYDASSNLVGSMLIYSGGSDCTPPSTSVSTSSTTSSSGTSTITETHSEPVYFLSTTWGQKVTTKTTTATWTHTSLSTFAFTATSSMTTVLTPTATPCGTATGTPCTITSSNIAMSGTGTGNPAAWAASRTATSDGGNSVGDTTVTGTACTALGAINGGFVDISDDEIHVATSNVGTTTGGTTTVNLTPTLTVPMIGSATTHCPTTTLGVNMTTGTGTNTGTGTASVTLNIEFTYSGVPYLLSGTGAASISMTSGAVSVTGVTVTGITVRPVTTDSTTSTCTAGANKCGTVNVNFATGLTGTFSGTIVGNGLSGTAHIGGFATIAAAGCTPPFSALNGKTATLTSWTIAF